jgi:hypothetical protein
VSTGFGNEVSSDIGESPLHSRVENRSDISTLVILPCILVAVKEAERTQLAVGTIPPEPGHHSMLDHWKDDACVSRLLTLRRTIIVS